jgi:ATP-dependent helicase STH1/SNF2
MNDEGINEILARSEEEAVLFRLEELPDRYRADEPFEIADVVDEIEGRGLRRRTVVNHNDGLDDEQWAVALEDGEDVNGSRRQRPQV